MKRVRKAKSVVKKNFTTEPVIVDAALVAPSLQDRRTPAQKEHDRIIANTPPAEHIEVPPYTYQSPTAVPAVVVQPSALSTHRVEYTQDKIDLIRRTYAKGCTDDELALFIQVAQRTQLDIFARQIYAVKRWDSSEEKYVMQTQTSIDGFRTIAERTGEYQGQTPRQWCGKDGVWKEVWLSSDAPAAARVGVYRRGFREALYGVARFEAYVVKYKTKSGDWVVGHMWKKMPDVMLAKCAEALALRTAFPQELSGLYTSDEMEQANNGQIKNITPTREETPEPHHDDPPQIPTDAQPAESNEILDKTVYCTWKNESFGKKWTEISTENLSSTKEFLEKRYKGTQRAEMIAAIEKILIARGKGNAPIPSDEKDGDLYDEKLDRFVNDGRAPSKGN